MAVSFYRMRAGQEGQVVDLILELIAAYGTTFKSVLTPQSLSQSSDFLNVEVAEEDGSIIGICAWVPTFSTWRGVKGIYVADHFVRPGEGSVETARSLLHLAASNGAAAGARFIRVEVDVTDEASEILYTEIGFDQQTRHNLYFLEPAEFSAFIASEPKAA
jgi:hypothetical protein